VKPRQRPRPADNSSRQSQPPGVGICETHEPLVPVAKSAAVVSAAATAASANASRQKQQQQQQQQQQQLHSKQQQDSLVFTSDQSRVTQPVNDMSSLIDLDPESTLLANLDPLKPPLSPFSPSQFTAGQQLRPFFHNVSHANPFASSAVDSFNSASGTLMQTAAGFASHPPGVVPHNCLSYTVHGCGQQAVGYPAAVPYSAPRMMTPQYRCVAVQPKTGSNNDIHLLQVSGYLPTTCKLNLYVHQMWRGTGALASEGMATLPKVTRSY